MPQETGRRSHCRRLSARDRHAAERLHEDPGGQRRRDLRESALSLGRSIAAVIASDDRRGRVRSKDGALLPKSPPQG